MNALGGNFEIPLTGRELLTALRDGKPVQIGRPFLVKALQLVEECAEAVIDVQTKGDKAFLTPERFRLNKIGEQCIASVARVSGVTEVGFPADGASAEPALLDGAAPDGNAGPRPRHTGRAQRPASARNQGLAPQGETDGK